MLQASLSQPNIAAVAQTAAPDGLRMGTFDPGAGRILLAEHLSSLNLAGAL
jgi:hypothetical protein